MLGLKIQSDFRDVLTHKGTPVNSSSVKVSRGASQPDGTGQEGTLAGQLNDSFQ